jgi:hypothetical protein
MDNKARETIKYFLYEAEIFTEKEISFMSTDSINDSIREVAKAILGSIVEKSDSIDTSPIDKSRGDIKQLPNLDSLQTAINQLEAMVERSSEEYDMRLFKYLKEIEKALLNINKYSAEFKEAYKSRKTLLILKYQSLIMSILSGVSYLISVMVDFSAGDIELKTGRQWQEIAPLKTIRDFNKSVEKGEFKEMIKEVSVMREEFLEVSKESLELLESYDISSILMNGIKMLYSSFSDNPKLIEFLYKAAGIITMLISLREVFYMFFKAKSKVEDVIGHIDNFANVNTSGSSVLLAKLNTFSNKFVVDAEESSKMATREIESENKELGSEIRAIPTRIMQQQEIKKDEEVPPQEQPESQSDNSFGDIGFDF